MFVFSKGDLITGRVTGVESYGIFLSLDNGVTGLIHISEISDSFVKNIYDYVDIDDVIRAKVLDYDEVNKRLKLSIKNLQYSDNVKHNHVIIETKSGFSTLKGCLDGWISDKVAEIDNSF